MIGFAAKGSSQLAARRVNGLSQATGSSRDPGRRLHPHGAVDEVYVPYGDRIPEDLHISGSMRTYIPVQVILVPVLYLSLIHI